MLVPPPPSFQGKRQVTSFSFTGGKATSIFLRNYFVIRFLVHDIILKAKERIPLPQKFVESMGRHCWSRIERTCLKKGRKQHSTLTRSCYIYKYNFLSDTLYPVKNIIYFRSADREGWVSFNTLNLASYFGQCSGCALNIFLSYLSDYFLRNPPHKVSKKHSKDTLIQIYKEQIRP